MRRMVGLAFGLALLSTTALAGAPVSTYHVTPLVSNQKGHAPVIDRSLVNAWGISDGADSPLLWVNAQGSDHSLTYDPGTGEKGNHRIRIPGGGPTGVVEIPANPDGSDDFLITHKGMSRRAYFAFATTSGRIEGYNGLVSETAGITAVDHGAAGSAFTGITFMAGPRIVLAADFGKNMVVKFNSNWNEVGNFTDSSLPEGYAPFNVRVIRGKVYVAFAQRGDDGEEVKGAGLGAIDIFDLNGNMLQQLVAPGGMLNAPWGMTIAPPGFGQYAGALLVGNFGDGTINAFDTTTGNRLGALKDKTEAPITLDGLWGINAGPGGSVTFASGPNDEQDGLVGKIQVDASGG